LNLIFTVKKIQLHYSKKLSDTQLGQVELFKEIILRQGIIIVDMTDFTKEKLYDQLKKVILIVAQKQFKL
jgi:hypothetical protein